MNNVEIGMMINECVTREKISETDLHRIINKAMEDTLDEVVSACEYRYLYEKDLELTIDDVKDICNKIKDGGIENE